ncbi:hypothetical protein [Streptococcus ovis]|uniref:hypothetical protein n=1 Tax=Streptococcus ovis TaxID=82806 RepID=UPI00036090A9|nr:hypothetical protein [Streptococcus ovis]
MIGEKIYEVRLYILGVIPLFKVRVNEEKLRKILIANLELNPDFHLEVFVEGKRYWVRLEDDRLVLAERS